MSILDPELVIPSERNVSSLEFWRRLDAWTARRDQYIGLQTLEALGELLGSMPAINGLPKHDLYRITGRIVSRPAPISDPARAICEPHFAAGYSPFWGHPDNVARLALDIGSADATAELALATDLRAWPGKLSDPACSACATAPSQLLGTPSDDPSLAWRAWLSRQSWGLPEMEAHAEKLFPRVHFATGAWTRAADALPRGMSPAVLLHHIGVLNDHAQRIWRDHVDTRMREQQLGSLGIEASLDSPSTHKNKAAMDERKFVVDGVTVTCEWHTKITPTEGRVHFTVQEGRVIVGTIVDHLTT
ncbi:hypothetical protein [Microbacterium sp. P03]|uniref:hypothetical protein n=1 Tax=Microbacterium sp. P03 TaxID=3366946 RepID=UPI0037450980